MYYGKDHVYNLLLLKVYMSYTDRANEVKIEINHVRQSADN